MSVLDIRSAIGQERDATPAYYEFKVLEQDKDHRCGGHGGKAAILSRAAGTTHPRAGVMDFDLWTILKTRNMRKTCCFLVVSKIPQNDRFTRLHLIG